MYRYSDVDFACSKTLLSQIFNFTDLPNHQCDQIKEQKSSNQAVVVAQLVERSLPIPEVCSLNLVIGKNLFIYWTFVFCQLCIEKTKITKKRPGMAHKKVVIFPKSCQKGATTDYIKIITLLKWPNKFQDIWAILQEKLTPRSFKDSPILSHCSSLRPWCKNWKESLKKIT